MKMLWILAAALALALTGCGGDERERLINRAIDQLTNAQTHMAAIKDSVLKWEKEKKQQEKLRLLQSAKDAAKAFRKTAKEFQKIKQEADKLDASTPEDRKTYVEKFRERFAQAIENVDKERLALNAAIARAEKTAKGQLAELKSSLRDAQGDFESLAKQR
jgi:uncharacterized lipoprotein YehR (DUF1307 family)